MIIMILSPGWTRCTAAPFTITSPAPGARNGVILEPRTVIDVDGVHQFVHADIGGIQQFRGERQRSYIRPAVTRMPLRARHSGRLAGFSRSARAVPYTGTCAPEIASEEPSHRKRMTLAMRSGVTQEE
jgi:hypothetical protein